MAVELYGIDYDPGSKTLTASQKISVGEAAAGSLTVKLKNMKLSHKESFVAQTAEVIVTADTTVTTAVSFDFGKFAGIPSSIVLGTLPIAGIGSVTLSMDYSLAGGVSMTWDGKLTTGVSYDNGDFRLIKNYTKTGFSFTAEAKVQAGMRLAAAVDLVAAKGSIYGTVGVKMNHKYQSYDTGSPSACVTIKGYMYAKAGASVSVFGQSVLTDDREIFTEANSLVRVAYHYEDGKLVTVCARGSSHKYATAVSSRYFNPSPSYGQSSYGDDSGEGGSSGVEPVVIWEYTTDDGGNVTITKYNGNARSVAIPAVLDGHTVTEIGSKAFYKNTSLYAINIPNSVKIIGDSAFNECTNLSSVVLSENLKTLGRSAFANCKSLKEITIPYSINEIESYAFRDCTALNNVSLPDSIVTISGYLFKGCTSLTKIKIPYVAKNIENNAFSNCTNLKEIILPDSLEKIGYI